MSGAFPVTEKENRVIKEFDATESVLNCSISRGYAATCKRHKRYDYDCKVCKEHEEYKFLKNKFNRLCEQRAKLFVQRCASFDSF